MYHKNTTMLNENKQNFIIQKTSEINIANFNILTLPSSQHSLWESVFSAVRPEVIYSGQIVSEERVGGQERKEGKQQFGSNQDSVGKGCQKSGCGGYSDRRVVLIYSVVNWKAEGVRRDSVVLGCEVW
jgi:hypothetical protein